MSTIQQSFDAAVLADAVYLDLGGQPLSGAALKSKLMEGGRLTEAQAKYISDHYDLVAFEGDGAGSFQAAVFRDKRVADGQPGQYTLAIRGTQQPLDFYEDAQLALIGRARDQAVAMYSFIAKLSTPGPLGFGLPSDVQFAVTGHSLGGHLVQLLVSENPEIVSSAFTFNGAGLGNNAFPTGASISRTLRAAWAIYGGTPVNVTNIISEPGPEVTASLLTGPRLGSTQTIFTEDQTGIDPFSNHYVGPQVDALAVYRVFEYLEGAANFDFGRMRRLLSASADTPAETLESALNTLALILGVSGVATPGNRQSLHALAAAVYGDLSNRLPGQATPLISLVDLTASQIAVQAARNDDTGMAFRLALRNELSFVVGGINYDGFNIDGELNYDSASVDYWFDRARYLSAILDANTSDDEGSGPSDAILIDLQTGASFTGLSNPNPAVHNQIVFGRAAGNDSITGGAGNDHLYGGVGNGSDVLDGGADGNDYLEGGGGNDWLVARSGQDTLDGGAGADTYEIAQDADSVLVHDSDGAGFIIVERSGSTYTLGSSTIHEVASSPGHYEDSEGNRYQFNGGDLIVSLEDGRHITIDEFQTMGGNRLGLTLQTGSNPTAPTAPNGTLTFSVTPGTPPTPPDENAYGGYSSDSSQPYAGWLSPGALFGASVAEQVTAQSVAGNRYYTVAAGMGDSYLTGDAGQNWLVDDAIKLPDLSVANIGEIVGNDVLRGGGDNDVLLTHGGNDWSFGDDGHDILIDQPEATYGSTAWVNGTGHANRDHLFGMVGNDVLAANGGSAFMDGGSDNDELYGGAHDDTLIGGSGNDVLSGDTRLRASPWTVSGTLGSITVTENLNGIWEGEQLEAGNDTLFGDAGTDTLIGGLGNDFLDGGADADQLQGDLLFIPSELASRFSAHQLDPGTQHGADVLWGGGGNDTLYGGGGSDHLYGEADNDVLYGDDNPQRTGFLSAEHHGDDQLDGGAGNDYLYGNGGIDTLLAGDGDDYAYGGAGNDVIVGGAGIDYLVGDDLDGAQGSDTIRGGDQDDTLFGMGGNDSLYGDSGADTLTGGGGDDILEGGDNDDDLFGQEGNDHLHGGAGADVISGNAGDDVLIGSAGGDALFGDEGNDRFILSVGTGPIQISDDAGQTVVQFEAGISAADVHISRYYGTFYLDFAQGDYIFMSEATLNSIVRLEFADGTVIDPAALIHSFQPQESSFARQIPLLAGVTIPEIGLLRRNNDLVLTYAGTVTDWVNTSALAANGVVYQTAQSSDYDLPPLARVLVLTNWFVGQDGTYLDQLQESWGGVSSIATRAFAAPATFVATSPTDVVLEGVSTDDRLLGSGGDDILSGEAGNDELNGNSGNDLLIGGAGDDVYGIGSGNGRDHIADAEGVADRIRFGAGITAGDLILTESAMGLNVTIGSAALGNAVVILDHSADGGQQQPIEFFEFSDGTTLNSTQIDALITGNRRPVSQVPAQDHLVGRAETFSFALPAGLFVDPEGGNLSYVATTTGGTLWPGWLAFDSITRTFSGTAAGASATFEIRVTATDTLGLPAHSAFNLVYDFNLLRGDANANSILGDAADNRLVGYGGNDVLIGGRGDDTLDGGPGDDSLEGGLGMDTYTVGATSGHDTIIESRGLDRVEFADDIAISAVSAARIGNDLRMQYGSSSLTISGWYLNADAQIEEFVFRANGQEYIYAPYQIQALVDGVDGAPHAAQAPHPIVVAEGQAFSYQLPDNLFTDVESQEGLIYSVTNLASWLSFDAATRTLSGTPPLTSEGAATGFFLYASDGVTTPDYPEYINIVVHTRPNLNMILGTENADVLTGGAGHDYIDAGAGADTINPGRGNNTVYAGEGDDIIKVYRGNPSIYGEGGNDRILGQESSGAFIDGGAGDDWIAVSGASVTGGRGNDHIEGAWWQRGDAGNDRLIGSTNADTLYGGDDDDEIDGDNGADELYGDDGDDALRGGRGNDVLRGGRGGDRLNGDTEDDDLYGDAGNDIYFGFSGTSGADYLLDSGGYDTVEFSPTANITSADLLFSTVNINTYRIALNGTSAALDIGMNSTASGLVSSVEEFVLYAGGSAYRYNLEQINARLAGINSAPVAWGDPLIATIGVAEQLSLQLAENLFSDVEDQLSLTYEATTTQGMPLPTWLNFNASSRTFSGTPQIQDSGVFAVNYSATDAAGLTTSRPIWIRVGTSQTIGTAGSDVLGGTSAGDFLVAGAGNDSVQGLSGDDMLFGDEGDDVLDGGAGTDYAVGGVGNDLYYIDSELDRVIESVGSGTDEVRANVNFRLGDNVENLLLLDAQIGRGNELDNTITGNALDNTLFGYEGNDVLDGLGGNDTMYGGFGSDRYYVDSSADSIVEELTWQNGGIDSVYSASSYTLSDEVENLFLIGAGNHNAIGNYSDNILSGNAGDNLLDGREGADTMMGGGGNDTFAVDSTADVTVENFGEGTDTVNSSVDHILGQYVENLTLTGTSNIQGTGNALDNVIVGNSRNNVLIGAEGNDLLNGGSGSDTMIGGLGNDVYTVAQAGDLVSEDANQGIDLVQSSVAFTLGDNLENLTLTGSSSIGGTGNVLDNLLTGNSGNNILTGGGGSDTLNGGSGSDTMIGGQGNDAYVVAQTGDVVTEAVNEGTDLIQSSVTYTLSNNVENLTLTGTSTINGTGNALDNILIGNSANNTLTGQAGNDVLDGSSGTDTMLGGQGNDTYFVNISADVTTESANEGIDTVNSSVTRTLAANIELLFLTGTSVTSGTGNALSNLLRGNTANNTLAGAGGVDILEGGAGNDILSNASGKTLLNGGAGTDALTGTSSNDLLIGGADNDALTTGQGADVIVFNKGDGQDTVAVSTTRDNSLSVGGGALYADLLFRKNGNDLILQVGATDQITFTGYYASSSNRSVNNLQVVIEGTGDYDASSADATRNKKIETFNFEGLVAAFDAARTADPGLTSWALTNALLTQHLSGSDTAALGGDLAYRYGRFGNLSDISFTPAIGILGAGTFGTSAQTLQSLTSLQDSSARLN